MLPCLHLIHLKTNNFTSIMEGFGMKMDNQSNQFKVLNTKIGLLETKIDKFQKRCLFHEFKVNASGSSKDSLQCQCCNHKDKSTTSTICPSSPPQETSMQYERHCTKKCDKLTMSQKCKRLLPTL